MNDSTIRFRFFSLQKSILDRCNLLITTYEVIRSDIAFFQ